MDLNQLGTYAWLDARLTWEALKKNLACVEIGGRFLDEVKHKITSSPSTSTPEELKQFLNRSLCKNVHSSIVHNSQRSRQPKCPSAEEQLDTLGRMHTAEISLEICEFLIMLGEHHASERSLAESHMLYGSVSRK